MNLTLLPPTEPSPKTTQLSTTSATQPTTATSTAKQSVETSTIVPRTSKITTTSTASSTMPFPTTGTTKQSTSSTTMSTTGVTVKNSTTISTTGSSTTTNMTNQSTLTSATTSTPGATTSTPMASSTRSTPLQEVRRNTKVDLFACLFSDIAKKSMPEFINYSSLIYTTLCSPPWRFLRQKKTLRWLLFPLSVSKWMGVKESNEKSIRFKFTGQCREQICTSFWGIYTLWLTSKRVKCKCFSFIEYRAKNSRLTSAPVLNCFRASVEDFWEGVSVNVTQLLSTTPSTTTVPSTSPKLLRPWSYLYCLCIFCCVLV